MVLEYARARACVCVCVRVCELCACFRDQSTHTEDVHSIQPQPSSSNATKPVMFCAVNKVFTQRVMARRDPVVNQEEQEGGRCEWGGGGSRPSGDSGPPLLTPSPRGVVVTMCV